MSKFHIYKIAHFPLNSYEWYDMLERREKLFNDNLGDWYDAGTLEIELRMEDVQDIAKMLNVKESEIIDLINQGVEFIHVFN